MLSQIITCIIAFLFAISALIILLVFISYDLKQMRIYKNAKHSRGIVLEYLETEKVAAYGRNQSRKYAKYKVQFQTEYGLATDALLMRNQKLRPGDVVEVHYTVDQTGIHTVNDVSVRRLREILIIAIITIVILAIIFLVER